MYPYARPNLSMSLEIGDNKINIKKASNIRLVEMSGMTSPSMQLATQDYVFDGGYISNKRYGMRSIGITIGISSLPQAEDLRQEIMSALHGKSEAKLTVKRNGQIRVIKGYINGQPETTQANLNYNRPSINIPLLCPDPYFYDPTATEIALTGGTRKTINNYGDVPMGFDLAIAISGAVTDPLITCGTGEFIQVKGSFVSGDRLIVSTTERNKTIKKNGNDWLQYTLTSTFFEFPIGVSSIILTATSGQANMSGTLNYKKRYLGI